MRRKILRGPGLGSLLVSLWLGLIPASSVAALQPDEQLADIALEHRAAQLDTQLRCVVCTAQSIASSEAPLAQDMRAVVRRRLAAGDTNEEILAFMAAQYGDEILLKPPLQANTLVLWMIPVLILGFMGGVAIWMIRSNQRYFREARAQSPDSTATDERRDI